MNSLGEAVWITAETLLVVASKRKHKVTHGRVCRTTICGVSESSWENCREFWERLRWARHHYARKQDDAIFRPTDAARTLGENPGTYRTWEEPKDNGGRVPEMPKIQKIAEKFGVSWVWLLSGQGSPHYDHVMEEQFNAFQRRLPEIPEEKREDAFRAARAAFESFAARKTG